MGHYSSIHFKNQETNLKTLNLFKYRNHCPFEYSAYQQKFNKYSKVNHKKPT